VPCNQLAIKAGQLKKNTYGAIERSEFAPQAISELLAGLLDIKPDEVHFYPVGQARYNFSNERQSLEWITAEVTVLLQPDGTIQFFDGINPGMRLTGLRLERFAAQAEQLLNEMGLALVQQEVVAKIGSIAQIRTDQWDQNGSRVLTIRL
jgi:hypothetical protein